MSTERTSEPPPKGRDSPGPPRPNRPGNVPGSPTSSPRSISPSISSIVLVVSDLKRSVDFYEHLLQLGVPVRHDEVAVLSAGSGLPIITLRQAYRNPRRAGDEDIGPRAVTFDVGSFDALHQVESEFRATGSFDRRYEVGPVGHCGVVSGHDPDRVHLSFLAVDDELTPEDLEVLQTRVYAL